jgi:hypothetical protein
MKRLEILKITATADTGQRPIPSNSGILKSESHRHFQRSIVTNCQGRDEIDLGIDDLIVVDPHEVHAPSRRSDKELAAVLALLDEAVPGRINAYIDSVGSSKSARSAIILSGISDRDATVERLRWVLSDMESWRNETAKDNKPLPQIGVRKIEVAKKLIEEISSGRNQAF